jgi:hypothetical protein
MMTINIFSKTKEVLTNTSIRWILPVKVSGIAPDFREYFTNRRLGGVLIIQRLIGNGSRWPRPTGKAGEAQYLLMHNAGTSSHRWQEECFMTSTRLQAWTVLMGSMGLAGTLVFSGGLTSPTRTATVRGNTPTPASTLIPATQVSVQQPLAKAGHANLKPRQGFSSLPLAAQPVVSATLGQSDARYQVRPKAGAQSRQADVPRASCPCSGMAKMAMAHADVPRASCPCSGMAKMAMAQSRGALSARNPAQSLEADFTPQGMEVRSGQTHWRFHLSSYGYGDRLEKVADAAPQSQGNRVEYQRGPLVEWYVNGPAGLEQGFTFNAPPASEPSGHGVRDTGHGMPSSSPLNMVSETGLGAQAGVPVPPEDSSPLTIALKIGGDLTATADSSTEAKGARAEGLTLRDGHGQAVLRYTGLTARDATGRALAAWLEVGKEELRLRVADAGARYPVVVDPFVQQAKLTASDGVSGDELGFSVSVSSDGSTIVAGVPYALVGSNGYPGAAYVFVKPMGGWANMTETVKLTASDGESDDSLGLSVAVSSDGSTIVAGAPNATIGSNPYQGAAYVFVKPGGGWANMTQTAKLTASDGAVKDGLGSVGVSSDGSTIVAGAPFATIGSNASQGAAYVFLKPTGGWASTSAFTAKLTASDGASGDYLGYSTGVSGDGSTIVAGALDVTLGSNPGPGAAYVFVRPRAGWSNTSTFTAKLTASDGVGENELGESVGVSSDGRTIVAGAYTATVGSNSGQGAAYAFVMPSSGGWVSSNETAKLTASDGEPYDGLGFSVGVSTDGGTIVAGAPFATIGTTSRQGAEYVFVVPGSGGWVSGNEIAKLIASDTPNSRNHAVFGFSVGVSGDGEAIESGAPGADFSRGTAYVFLTAPKVTFTGAPSKLAYQETFTVASTTDSSTSPVYTSSGSCSNISTVYTMTSTSGVCTSTVTWAGDANYAGATLSHTTTATKIGQTVSFTTSAPSTESYKGTFPVAADSTSGLTVALSVATASKSVCSLSGGTVTMLSGTGTCTIEANQAGNADYSAATEEHTSAAAQKIGQTISFTKKAPSTASYNSTFAVAADSTSGLKVVFSVDAASTGVCSLTSATVKMLSGTGTCTIDANQAGNADYTAAAQQQTSAAAKTAAQTISFTTKAPASASKNSTFPVAAKSTSALTVALSVDAGSAGVCSLGTPTVVSGVTSATVTMLESTGTCTIDANQAGNADYSAAAQRQTSAKATP